MVFKSTYILVGHVPVRPFSKRHHFPHDNAVAPHIAGRGELPVGDGLWCRPPHWNLPTLREAEKRQMRNTQNTANANSFQPWRQAFFHTSVWQNSFAFKCDHSHCRDCLSLSVKEDNPLFHQGYQSSSGGRGSVHVTPPMSQRPLPTAFALHTSSNITFTVSLPLGSVWINQVERVYL